jgi:hypothetical protein
MDREGAMPDADDFDVEYFRSLLKGNQPPQKDAQPAAAPRPAAKSKPARSASKPAAAKAKAAPASGRKKGGKR